MLRKLGLVLGAVVLVAALGLLAVGAVAAQGPGNAPGGAAGTPLGQVWGRVCRGAGLVAQAVSKLLGLTPEQIHTERAAGKTLAQIAADKGVTEQQLIDAIVAARAEQIAQAVKDGRITQAQADWLLAKAKAMAPFQITNPFGPGGMRGRMAGAGAEQRGMGGMRGGGRGRWAAPSATPAQ